MANDRNGKFSYSVVLLPFLVAYAMALYVVWYRGWLAILVATLALACSSAAIFAALTGIHLFVAHEPAGIRTLRLFGWLAAGLGLVITIEVVAGIR